MRIRQFLALVAYVQPTSAYDYHALPVGLIEQLDGDSNRMRIVGWAADGFPLHTAKGYSDPKDARSAIKKVLPSYRLRQRERDVAAGDPPGRGRGEPGGGEGPGGRQPLSPILQALNVSGDTALTRDEFGAAPGQSIQSPRSMKKYCRTQAN